MGAALSATGRAGSARDAAHTGPNNSTKAVSRVMRDVIRHGSRENIRKTGGAKHLGLYHIAPLPQRLRHPSAFTGGFPSLWRVAALKSPAIPLAPAYLRSFAGVSFRRTACPTFRNPIPPNLILRNLILPSPNNQNPNLD